MLLHLRFRELFSYESLASVPKLLKSYYLVY